jgi:MprA protease rhombosortase-interaction domain-containing protein
VQSTSPAPAQGAPANNNPPSHRQSRDLDTGRGGGGAIDPISGAIVLALGGLAAASLRHRRAA